MEKYVAYYRVSTQRQGQSGLGLEAQKHAVTVFTKGKGIVIAEYTEVESGKNDSRVKLALALAEAKREKATLVIAKLDRLSRNASFIFSLRDSGVDFVCCDLPEATTLTIGIFAVIAQHERETISRRIKEALAAKKARGEPVGNPKNFTNRTRAIGRKAKNEKALAANDQALNIAKDAQAQGLSLQKVAERLNSYGIKTSRGNSFTKSSVQSLLKLV
jgi:DNA invertase Pin-like site-specific DNA recombinase